MHLNHFTFVTSHNQSDGILQRLGSCLGRIFMYSGSHPHFGIRNFKLPLQNGPYVEFVYQLNNQAAGVSPFGKDVTKRDTEGAGWLTGIVSVDYVSMI